MAAIAESRHAEPWPIWAKVLVIIMSLLVMATIIPWVFMANAMATTCTQMMGPTIEMMR